MTTAYVTCIDSAVQLVTYVCIALLYMYFFIQFGGQLEILEYLASCTTLTPFLL